MTQNYTPTPFPSFPKVKGFIQGEHTHIACDLSPEEYELVKIACNAHDDLVAALEALNNSWIETFPNGPETELREGCSIHEDTLKIWRMAQAALAKAKIQS